MALVDELRGFITQVDKLGELKQLDGVGWNEEMGCIAELNKSDNAPAIIFDNIKDYPQGYRVMCSSLRSTPLDPMIRKPTNAYYNSRAIIDACKPFDWIDEFPKEVKSNPKIAEKVKKK